MPRTIGTRVRQNQQKMHPDQGTRTRSRNTDKGMKKLVTASITFTASDGKATATSGSFTGNFAAGDPVEIFNTNLNNGFHNVKSTDGDTYIVLDPPPKDEGPLTCTLRTP